MKHAFFPLTPHNSHERDVVRAKANAKKKELVCERFTAFIATTLRIQETRGSKRIVTFAGRSFVHLSQARDFMMIAT